MTKKIFAEMLLGIINTSEMIGKTNAEIIEEIEIFLGCLEPKNRDRFAQWGRPEERTTYLKCWE